MLWQYISNGDWDGAIAAYTAQIDTGGAEYHDYANRAYLYAHRGNLEAAFSDMVIADIQVKNNLIYAADLGVLAWGLGLYEHAITSWKSGIHPKKGGSPNGIQAPAYLTFAGIKRNDANLMGIGRRLLSEQITPKNSEIWPWPIASLLLDRISDVDIINHMPCSNALLEAKRYCRASFWAAIWNLAVGKTEQYAQLLAQCVRKEPIHDLNYVKFLQSEYIMAQILINEP